MFKKNRSSLILLGAVIFVGIVAALAVILLGGEDEDPKDIYTVGIVNIASVLNPAVDGFKEGMTTLGYTEGENITYLYDGPISSDDREAKLQEYVDQDVDVILTLTTPVTVSAKTITAESGIPVVFAPVTDPLAAGIITDLTRPGGNITGVISGSSEPKRMEWLVKIAPEAKRILFPYNPNDSSPVNALIELNAIVDVLGIELVTMEVADAEAVQAVIDNLPDDIDAIYLGPDALVGSLYPQWVEVSIAKQLPISGSSLAHVEGGILCSYSYSPFEAGKNAAHLADRILKGADPGELPIETTEPVSSLNLDTMSAMGLDVPDTILRQAQVLIQEDAE